MALSGKFIADFASFYDAVRKAQVSLKDFETGSNKVETSLNRMVDSFSGRKIITDANLMTKAITETGGASALTAREQARVNDTLAEAIAKYAALGRQAPAAMLALADATKQGAVDTEGLSTRMVALGSFIGTMAANAVAALGRLAMNGIRAVVSGIGDIISSGSEISGITQSFETLAAGINATGTAMLGAMRTGTRGMVVDLDLMRAANKAVLLGLPITSAEMGTLAATATTLGRAMGLGPTKAFDDLITALGRSSPLILDNLGLSVKAGEANEMYARAIGKTVGELTDAESKQAFYNAAMAAARAKVEELGAAQLTLGDRVKQAGVWWANFRDDLSLAIARSPVLGAALNEVGKAFAETFGTATSDRIKTLNAWVSTLAVKLVDLASVGVSTAKYITEGFYLLRGVLFGVLESVANVVTLMASANATVAEFAASVPGIGRGWTAVATSARAAADTVSSVAASFRATKEGAFDAMGVASVTFQNAQERLSTMRTAMQAAAKEPIVSPVAVMNVERLAAAAGLVSTQIGTGFIPAVTATSRVLEQAAAQTDMWDSGLRFAATTLETYVGPALDTVRARVSAVAQEFVTLGRVTREVATGVTLSIMEIQAGLFRASEATQQMYQNAGFVQQVSMFGALNRPGGYSPSYPVSSGGFSGSGGGWNAPVSINMNGMLLSSDPGARQQLAAEIDRAVTDSLRRQGVRMSA